jgi:hypothetical protein
LTVSCHIPDPVVCISHFPHFSVLLPYSRTYSVHFSFSRFFNVFFPYFMSYSVSFSFSTFLSFLAT